MIVLSLFDGMSCGQIALQKLGITPEFYFASEIDQFAIKTTKKNFPDTIHLGDIQNWKSWDIPWSIVGLVLAGSPCQGFSFIGKNLQFNDPRSALFFTLVEILEHIKQVNPNVKFLVENVAMPTKSEAIFTEKLGVSPVHVNSLNYSDQNRVRLYWANWAVGEMRSRRDNNRLHLDPKLELFTKSHGVWTPRPLSTCLDANYSKGVDNHGQRTMVKEGELYRKLSPEECELLQTVPLGYTAGVSNTQRYKMLGNGWTVDVVADLLKYLLNAQN